MIDSLLEVRGKFAKFIINSYHLFKYVSEENASSVSSTRCMSATIMFVGILAALQMSRSESRNSNIRTSKHRNSSRSKEATSPSLVAQLAATTLTRIAPSKSTTVAFAQKRSDPKNRGCIKACALIASKEHR